MKKKKIKTDYISVMRQWRRLAGYSGRKISKNSITSSIFHSVEYTIKTPPKYKLDGKTLLFFSDTHCTDDIADTHVFTDTVNRIDPDWIVFGGDLITYACFMNSAFSWLNRTFAKFANIPKFAVPGNWDRRRKWFPQKIWAEKYRECGFQLLVNEECIVGGLRFYGLDDPRTGTSELKQKKLDSEYFNCIVSHNVEPVVDSINNSTLPGNNLVLCGHSHGGQIRIPYFGAIFTSSKYWKIFEYGHYAHKTSDTDMIITSGVGTTRLPIRLFCNPEIVVIRFRDQS